jgi:hypothetical protein
MEAAGSEESGELNDEGRFHDSHYFVHKEQFFLTPCDTEANCIVTYLVQKIRVHHLKTILGCNETLTVL